MKGQSVFMIVLLFLMLLMFAGVLASERRDSGHVGGEVLDGDIMSGVVPVEY